MRSSISIRVVKIWYFVNGLWQWHCLANVQCGSGGDAGGTTTEVATGQK